MNRPFLKAIRPTQWVKNLFVVAPLLFAHRLTDPHALLEAALAFIAFSFAASGVYLLNDLSDKERDQQHPTKKHRPIASGSLSVRYAKSGILVLWSITAALSAILGLGFFLSIFAYLAINFLYSFYLRSVPIVDVAIIALGFLLRVVAGGEAIHVPLSKWIILNTFLLAFFMGLGKRHQELSSHGSSARDSLLRYSPRILHALLYLTGALTVVAYFLYAQSHGVVSFGTPHFTWTTLFPALGIGRFVMLCGRPDQSPTEAILRDKPFLVIVGAWSLLVILLVV